MGKRKRARKESRDRMGMTYLEKMILKWSCRISRRMQGADEKRIRLQLLVQDQKKVHLGKGSQESVY